MTHQPDHENTADKAAVTPPPALTTEGRLRARVQTLEEDAERNQGLAKVGARCMREGHQGLIESGRATVEGHRFALSVALDLGTGATWDAIHERVKELRRDSAAPAAVSAAVAPPTNQTATDASETPRQWCKCPSCWGWFVEEHPGEDLDELGTDLSWWSGLPEHRDAPDSELRRMADETATEESDGARLATLETDLADGPVRCPLCPTPLTLHTPSGARAHFTTVHPEQRITGRESGPWPLLVADETATETPFTPPAHYRRDDGVDCCVHAIPVGPNSCQACRELADEQPASGPTIVDQVVAALQAKAQALSVEAEEEMRRDLEEQAQVWHEAADLARRTARKAARSAQPAAGARQDQTATETPKEQ